MDSTIFFYFIQKTINQTNQIYDYENIYSFWENIFEKERNDQRYDFLIKYLFYSFLQILFSQVRIRSSIQYMGFKKMNFLKYVMNNPFLCEKNRTEILDVFCRVQKLNYSFQRFAYLYKLKKADFQIVEDIYLNPISATHKNTMVLYQNNKKYLFVISDLINIINTAISHCDYFYPEPLVIKNPYNNIPLSKSILYNIYFFIKDRDFKLPLLFHFYFLCDFSIDLYKRKYEKNIIEEYIKRFVKNSSDDILSSHILNMIDEYNQHNKHKQLYIDSEFPKNILVSKFRYFLYYYLLYYHGQQSNDTEYYHSIWNEKMQLLQQINPEFGRKIIRIRSKYDFSNKNKSEVFFNDKCIDFHKINFSRNCFATSHLIHF